jgi:hypothetical protein
VSFVKQPPPGPRADAARTNGSHLERERKLSLLGEPHIAPLTDFVKRLRLARGDDAIPWFDPTEAGINASILMLLEAPGPRAALAKGSGFISSDNDDPTANNMWHILRDARIDRGKDVVSWNVVPWYIGDGTRIRAATRADYEQARGLLAELLSLLPRLRVVVLLGKKAAEAWELLGAKRVVYVIKAPHPSPKVVNTRPAARLEIKGAFEEARRLAGLEPA